MLLTGKILIISLLATALNLVTVNEPILDNSVNVAATQLQIGSVVGSIIIDDEIMFITLNDTGDKIDAVSVLDTDGKEVFSDNTSSSSSSSEYDLSSLASGTYTVYVTTEKGAAFSEDINLE